MIHWVRLDQYSSAEKAYNDGLKRLEKLVAKVQDIDPSVTIIFFGSLCIGLP